MTEAINESVQVEKPAAGNSETPAKAEDKGSSAEQANSTWLSGLSEGNRKLAETKGWTAPEHLDKAFTSYAELEKMQGESLRIPAPDAAKEEVDKFYSKLGRPETADKYEFKRPDNIPADMPYNDDLAEAAKPWMHGAGLSTKQAQQMHDGFQGYMAEQQTAYQANVAKSVETTHDSLVKEWGPKDGEKFKTELTLADRAISKLGLLDTFKKAGLVLPDGSLTDPQIAKAMAAVGVQFKEDTIDDKGGGGGGENPFKRDAGGKIVSPTAISALIKSDPERAKRMAREAGEPYDNWAPSNPR